MFSSADHVVHHMAKRDPVSGPQALALALANHPESCIGTAAPGPPVATEVNRLPSPAYPSQPLEHLLESALPPTHRPRPAKRMRMRALLRALQFTEGFVSGA